MAKKRFTADLFGLFEEPAADQPTPRPETTPVDPPAPEVAQDEQVEVDVPAPTPRAKRKLSSKKFTADLDAFLSESFEREARANPAPPSPTSAPAPPPSSPTGRPPKKRRRAGLDLLIRSTVSEGDQPPAPRAADTKRVTLVFQKEQLAELKEQARQRGIFLKDLVQEMVSDYLAE